MKAGLYWQPGRFGTFSGVKWLQLRYLHDTGVSTRRISQDLGIHRTTVKRYRKWAEEEGLLVGGNTAIGWG